ncbi:MAG: DUF6941 family protein [Gemmatimonadaceae bacterium]
MQIAFALLADGANLSQEGKLNILGVFDAVQVAQLPTVHPRAHLVLRLKGTRTDVGTHRITMQWMDPGGRELVSSTGELNVGTPPPGVNDIDVPLIATIDLPLETPGVYTLALSLDDAPMVAVPLQVRGGAPPMPAGFGGGGQSMVS